MISLAFNSRTEQIYSASFTDNCIIPRGKIGNIGGMFSGIKITVNTSYRH